MDWPLIITSITGMMSGLGACASALATWRTVQEMKKQREASYMPQIACSLPALISAERQSTLTIYNVGLGTARDVDVSIQMPTDFLMPFNKAMEKKCIHLKIQHGNLHIEKMCFDGSESCHSISIPCAAHIQFLAPGTAHGEYLRLPGFLPELLALLANNRIPENREEFWAILRSIHLDVFAEYSDIGGKHYTFNKRYSVFDADYQVDDQRLALRFI